MSARELLQRHFRWVVLAGLALAAYFQARGTGRLLSSSLDVAVSSAPRALEIPSDGVGRGDHGDGTAIKQRNAFDSVTGPLGEREADAAAPQPLISTDPLSAPGCANLHATIISEAPGDPRASAATLAVGESPPVRYSVGDTVDGKRLEFIGFNPRENSPAVWLRDQSGLCQALLFKEAPSAPPPAVPAEPTGDQPGADGARGRAQPAADPELLKQIHSAGDQVTLSKQAFQDVLSHELELMPKEMILNEQYSGKATGIRILGILPDTLLAQLGFESGDRLESIAGDPVSSREAALAAYGKLKAGGSFEIQVNRRGKPHTIRWRIR